MEDLHQHCLEVVMLETEAAEAVADAVAVAGAADVDNVIDRSVIRSLTCQWLKCLKP